MRRLALILIGVLSLGLTKAQTQTSPMQQDSLGPAFRMACGTGNVKEVISLLKQGAPLEGRDNLNRTGLFLACFGHPEIVKLLLAQGAKIDPVAKNGDTTIGVACEYGQLATAEMLLAAGADFNQTNQYGRTPLMLAAREGRDALVSLLIAHHVDVNYGRTSDPALFYAVWMNHPSTAKLLLDAGAKVTRPEDNPDPNPNPRTLVCLAAQTNNLSLIDLVLERGAQINERNKIGVSALMQEVISGTESTIQYLLEKGADPNLQNDKGETALMLSTLYEKFPAWQGLLDHGAKLEIKDRKGRTALIWACYHFYDPAIRFLIDHGADVNAADLKGETPLTYAGDRGHQKMVQLLKDKGATRTDLHIIPKEEANPPFSKSQLWALAVGALYAQWNGESHRAFVEKEPEGYEGPSRRVLEDEWEIKDRATLIRTVNELAQGPTFTGVINEQIQDSLSYHGTEPKLERAFQLIFLDAWWREKTNVAWDYCRAANLVREGVDAGYLQQAEAWPLLMPIARKTQTTFHSWREMSDNFLDSREIDANERSGDLRACGRLLLNPQEPNSPWNQLLWQTDLSAK